MCSSDLLVQRWQKDALYLHVKGENQAARGLYFSVGYQQQRDEIPVWARLWGQSPQQLLLRKSVRVPQPASSSQTND